MARIKTSALITDIRGSIGGSTFQRTNAGLVLKNISKKVDKLSDSSLVVRNILNNNQIEWRKLSGAQRDIWKSYANYTKTKQKNSNEFFINAQQLFLKVNNLRVLYSLPVLLVPEFSKCVILPVDIVASLNAGNLTLTTNRLINSGIEFLTLFATIPVTSTLNNAGSRFKSILFNTTTGSVFNIGSEYLNTIGAVLQNGDQIFIKYTVIDKLTGLPMPMTTKKITI